MSDETPSPLGQIAFDLPQSESGKPCEIQLQSDGKTMQVTIARLDDNQRFRVYVVYRKKTPVGELIEWYPRVRTWRVFPESRLAAVHAARAYGAFGNTEGVEFLAAFDTRDSAWVNQQPIPVETFVDDPLARRPSEFGMGLKRVIEALKELPPME